MIVPDSDAGDLWLRKMENPSHDSLSSGQLRSERDRSEADKRFRQARRELGKIIECRAKIANYGDPTNIDELAGILPDEENPLGEQTLTTRVVESRTPPSQMVEEAEEIEEKGGGKGEAPGGGGAGGGGGNSGGNGQGENGDRPAKHRGRVSLKHVRYIPLSSGEAIVAFNPTSDHPREIRLSLRPAGADRDPRSIPPVTIVEAIRVGEVEEPLPVRGGEVSFTPKSSERVTIRVGADGDLDRQAFGLP